MKSGTFSFSLFCDDIRFEIGNKQSYIGVYSGELGAPQFPLVLPKLCSVVTLVLPATIDPSGVSAALYMDDQQIERQELPVEVLEQGLAHLGSLPAEDRPKQIAVTFNFYMTDLNLKGPAVIRASTFVGTEELSAGRLRIRQANSPVLGAQVSG